MQADLFILTGQLFAMLAGFCTIRGNMKDKQMLWE